MRGGWFFLFFVFFFVSFFVFFFVFFFSHGGGDVIKIASDVAGGGRRAVLVKRPASFKS